MDFTQEQHDLAMWRLRISWQDIVASGKLFRPGYRSSGGPGPFVLSFQSSPAQDRGEIEEVLLLELYREIERMVLPFHVPGECQQ